MKTAVRVALTLVAVAALNSLAFADSTYSTQASFTAATSNPTTLDLSPYNPGGNGYYGYTNYYSPITIAAGNPTTASAAAGNYVAGEFYVIGSGAYCCNVGSDSLFSYPGLTLTFTNPIDALSWVGGNGADTPTNDDGYPLGGNILATIGSNTYTFSGGSGQVPAFGGITTTNPFTSITFLSNGNPQGDQYIELGDITYASAGSTGVTPEPSSLLLLATGLVGLAGAVRRKLAK